MRYHTPGRSPGTLVPEGKDLQKNPGKARNFEMAETFLLREITLLKTLIRAVLANPTRDKAAEHWNYFQTQWKQNIVNYIKNMNGQQIVNDVEIKQYQDNFKHRTAILLVSEYMSKLVEKEKVIQRFPHVLEEDNKLLFGINKSLRDIHLRLMPYHKLLKNPDFSIVR